MNSGPSYMSILFLCLCNCLVLSLDSCKRYLVIQEIFKYEKKRMMKLVEKIDQRKKTSKGINVRQKFPSRRWRNKKEKKNKNVVCSCKTVIFYFIIICGMRVCQSCTLLEEEKNGRLHKKLIGRMISSSCEFEERKRKESRLIFFMVGFSHRRNLYEWKKKRKKRNYVGIKENVMQKDEILQLK